MPDERTFCCPGCRLLQRPGTECVECGSMIAWIEAERDLFCFVPTALDVRADGTPRKKQVGLLPALTLATSWYVSVAVAFTLAPWLGAAVLGTTVAGGAAATLHNRKRKTIVATSKRRAPIAEGSTPCAGTVAPLTGGLRALVDKVGAPRGDDDAADGGGPVLVEQLEVCTRMGGLFVRRIRAAPFVIDTGGEMVIVTGEVRLLPRAGAFHRERLAPHDARLAALGVPADLISHGWLETTTLRPGDRCRALGLVGDESLPELAFHREGGSTRVMRGRRDAVVVVE
ncbi:MAG: hypothetical protein KF773_18235 [Deltaproteobacteria bacterium]|nr:hypothetical protein [Deltaproteobacteria bacterium]